MARLIARTPFAGLLPLSAGTVSVAEVDPGPITSVATSRDAHGAVSQSLAETTGVPLAETGRFRQSDGVLCSWAGLDSWFVMGAEVPPTPGAILTDQSDAWAVADLSGPDVREVLARLVPIELRPDVFGIGHAARTSFGHMACLLMRSASEVYRLMVFRSMAGSAAHEMDRAMRMVAARAVLADDEPEV